MPKLDNVVLFYYAMAVIEEFSYNGKIFSTMVSLYDTNLILPYILIFRKPCFRRFTGFRNYFFIFIFFYGSSSSMVRSLNDLFSPASISLKVAKNEVVLNFILDHAKNLRNKNPERDSIIFDAVFGVFYALLYCRKYCQLFRSQHSEINIAKIFLSRFLSA